MIDYRFVPLDKWPVVRTKDYARKKQSAFSVGYGATLSHLEKELKHLGAKECLFEADYANDQIRQDGRPRAGAKPNTPGMVVSFKSKHGPLRVACDRFVSNEANLRAIGLHLEHLRLASLYGVGESGEQYKGWAQLPAADPNRDYMAAVAFLAGANSATQSQTVSDLQAAYRAAAARLHPDRGGSHDEFVKLQAHWSVLSGSK